MQLEHADAMGPEDVPGGQSPHEDALLAAYFPAGHEVQIAAPPDEYFPAIQLVQDVDWVSEYVPDAQLACPVAPTEAATPPIAAYFPAAVFTHADIPSASVKVPDGHDSAATAASLVAEPFPLAEYLPEGTAVQEPALPGADL